MVDTMPPPNLQWFLHSRTRDLKLERPPLGRASPALAPEPSSWGCQLARHFRTGESVSSGQMLGVFVGNPGVRGGAPNPTAFCSVASRQQAPPEPGSPALRLMHINIYTYI